MNIMSHNINGFGRGDYKIPLIRKLVEDNKIDFVGLQETKRREISDWMIKNIWGSQDFDTVSKSALGQGGGLICIWNKHLFHKKTSDHQTGLHHSYRYLARNRGRNIDNKCVC